MWSIFYRDQHGGTDKVATAVRDGGEYLVAALCKRQSGLQKPWSVGKWKLPENREWVTEYWSIGITKQTNRKVSPKKKEYVGERKENLCKQCIIEAPNNSVLTTQWFISLHKRNPQEGTRCWMEASGSHQHQVSYLFHHPQHMPSILKITSWKEAKGRKKESSRKWHNTSHGVELNHLVIPTAKESKEACLLIQGIATTNISTIVINE